MLKKRKESNFEWDGWKVFLAILAGSVLLGTVIAPFMQPPNQEPVETTTDWNTPVSKSFSDAIGNCCYPLDCPQSKNNPKDCTCEYLIMCLNSEQVSKWINQDTNNLNLDWSKIATLDANCLSKLNCSPFVRDRNQAKDCQARIQACGKDSNRVDVID